MLDIFVLEEDYFQQARLEDAIHKSKQIYILRIGKVDLLSGAEAGFPLYYGKGLAFTLFSRYWI